MEHLSLLHNTSIWQKPRGMQFWRWMDAVSMFVQSQTTMSWSIFVFSPLFFPSCTAETHSRSSRVFDVQFRDTREKTRRQKIKLWRLKVSAGSLQLARSPVRPLQMTAIGQPSVCMSTFRIFGSIFTRQANGLKVTQSIVWKGKYTAFWSNLSLKNESCCCLIKVSSNSLHCPLSFSGL